MRVLRSCVLGVVVALTPEVAHAQSVLYSTSGLYPWSGYGGTLTYAGDINLDSVGDYLTTDAAAAGTTDPTIYVVSGVDGVAIGGLTTVKNIGFGVALDGGPDIDQDGIADFFVGSQWGTPGVQGQPPSNIPSAYIYSGATMQPYFHFKGTEGGEEFGARVRFLDDLDGDGIPECAVQSRYIQGAPGVKAEVVTIFRGGTGGLLRTHLSPFGESDFGQDIKSLGDLNADGIADYAVGAPRARKSPQSFEGAVIIFDGQSGGPIAQHWGTPFNFYGSVLAGIDDVNGDGANDYATNALFSLVTVSSLTGGVIGQLNPPAAHEFAGYEMPVTDDLDGDGGRDILIGCQGTLCSGIPALVAAGTSPLAIQYKFNRPVTDPPWDCLFPSSYASIGDVDGDGRHDWVASSAQAVDPLTGGRGIVRVLSRRPLYTATHKVSLASKPEAKLELNAGVAQAGGTYLLLASCSGTAGIPFAGLTIPLTFDACTYYSLVAANTPPFGNTLGTLSVDTGTAAASFDAVHVPPAANGLTMRFAYVGLGPGGYFTSNAESILIDLFGP